MKFVGQAIWKSELRTHRHAFCYCELDFNPMTLIYESNLHILKCICTQKMKLQDFQQLEPKQLDATENVTMQHSRVVKINRTRISNSQLFSQSSTINICNSAEYKRLMYMHL